MLRRLGSVAIVGSLLLASAGSAAALMFKANGCSATFASWDGSLGSDPDLRCNGPCSPQAGDCIATKRGRLFGTRWVQCRCNNAIGEGGLCSLSLKMKPRSNTWEPLCHDTNCDGECIGSVTGPHATPPVFFYACFCVV